MKATLEFIQETKDVEYLQRFGNLIINDIEVFEDRVKRSELSTSTKRILILESTNANTPYDEYIVNRRKYLLRLKEAYINRLIELQK
jgi:hypothetical protein